jgi:transcriptional regulator with XRE-family HTH domain
MALALRLEVNPLSIYRWESGRIEPNLASVVDLAQALEVTIDWLVVGRESKYRGKARAKRASSAPTLSAPSANG